MKNQILVLLTLFTGLFINAQVTITPSSFNVTDQITITISTAPQSCNQMGATPAKVYMHAGIGNDTNAFGFSVIGNWGQDDSIGLMTNNGNGTWSITLTPSTYFGLNGTQQANATKLGMVFRNANGSQTLKLPPSCMDFIFNVGTFQVNLTAPANNSSTIINSGENLNITATNTGGNANYNLKANGTSINTSSTSNYAFNHTNITSNTSYELEVTIGASTITRRFSVIVNPGSTTQAIPSGLVNGINYNITDNTKATLVLEAPGKDFVYVAGSFNNYTPDTTFAMKKDPSSSKFWLELTGLTPGANNTYQYWVVDQTPIANSPSLVKAADPCSTMILSPYDDQWIPNTTFPNRPAYPAGQEREVTWFKTGTTPYNWQVTNFAKPNKDKLVVYELLIRDFDANRNYQDVINRIQYFKDLGINAIQLMPIMEFEGNESWGYNTAFHMALDKFYGTPEKLKELVDLCHQNGIAVILDIAFNHAFGRNPMIRMWMNDPDGDGWGGPASDNPYFNTTARHSYSVGDDFNHSSTLTKNYVKQTVKHWIEEYKIDGFRWDLTKGFTQNCSGGDDACTNAYQQDRVDVLKEYADYCWSLDNNHYVIFEHLGTDGEEQQWANYRFGEGKGIMMWGEMYTQYKELAMGYATQNISRMSHTSRGFTGKRLIGYPESHDKDRMMYEAITYGNGGGAFPVNGNLTNALNRMGAIGATSILVPGPKMIWHFGELGNNQSIYTCANGTVNDEGTFYPGDCKLDTKEQVQWTGNWLADARRTSILRDWSKLIKLKTSEPVFMGDHAISPDVNNVKQRIYIYDNTIATTQLRNVVVLANFSVANLTINPSFPTDVYTYPMTWYDLMDNNAPVVINNPTDVISVNSGRFRVFGNKPATLSSDDFETIQNNIAIYPNPTKNSFALTQDASRLEIYNIAGQLVKTFNNVISNQQLDSTNLETGLYLIKITDTNGISQTKKMLKE
ncbi:MAG: T9SS C-terminal target domain-containing protein [Flavobacteriia bacterium]|jgi:1,4-alpha-glucan branching enzyme|uniref:alpha-amylase family glycosyl hydrolase n=1 Tax=Flavobacterium sp. TaxID=239 RepID=UPI002979A3D3|nr:MAG: T9SS C-terminal target domain-containing protein [Flavobacteriia bacterium]